MDPFIVLTDHPPRVAALLETLGSPGGPGRPPCHCVPRQRQLAEVWPQTVGAAPEVLLICSTPAHAARLLAHALQCWPDTLVWVHDTHLLPAQHIECLQAGADCVSSGQLSADELRARLGSLRRRHASLRHRRLQVGRFEYDEEGKVILLDGRKLPLSAREWLVLGQLLKRHPALCSREELLRQLARHHFGCSHQILDVNFHKLREKIHPLGVQIQTLRGLGYRLLMQPPPPPVLTAKPQARPRPPELMRLWFGQSPEPMGLA